MSNLSGQFVPSARRGLLFLLLIIASITYATMNRHWTVWLPYSYVAATPFAFLLVFRETQMYRETAKTSLDKAIYFVKLTFPGPIVAIFLTPVGGVVYGVIAAIIDILQWVAVQLSQNGRSAALAATVTAMLGAIFFVFRLKLRFMYGITETMVGLVVAGNRFGFDVQSESGGDAGVSLYLAVLTAGVFLVVRGLDNMHQAWTLKSDPMIKWIFSKPTKTAD